MKEIIFITYEISFDKQNWLYVQDGWKFAEPSSPAIAFYSNFEELYNLLGKKSIAGISRDDSLFRKRPQIRVTAWDYTRVYTPKNFENIYYRKREKVDKPCVSWLLDNLTLEELSEYIKDRNITIPITIK